MKSTDFIDYYNKVYSKPYDSSRWDPIYENIKGFLVDRSILDLGCGVGSLCRFEDRWAYYTGVDISDVAIEKAMSAFPGKFFMNGDIERNIFAYNYDIVVAIQTFEHVDFKRVISHLNPVEIIFSLPNYASHSHLWFPKDTKELHRAFDPLIDFDIIHTLEVNEVKKIWTCKGVIKG